MAARWSRSKGEAVACDCANLWLALLYGGVMGAAAGIVVALALAAWDTHHRGRP